MGEILWDIFSFSGKGSPHRIFFANFGLTPPAACLPIVYVPVHIVMGMPMTVGMRMRVAITMGTKIHNRHCPWLQSWACPFYFGCAHGSFPQAHQILLFCKLFFYANKK